MRMIAGTSASGLKRRATRTGGAHETNGPKNGIACRMPADGRRSGRRSGRPRSRLVTSAIRK